MRYPVTAAPPSDVGGAHSSTTEPSAGVAISRDGASGARAGAAVVVGVGDAGGAGSGEEAGAGGAGSGEEAGAGAAGGVGTFAGGEPWTAARTTAVAAERAVVLRAPADAVTTDRSVRPVSAAATA